MSKLGFFELFKLPKLISGKIWVAEKLLYSHIFCWYKLQTIVYVEFFKGEQSLLALLQITIFFFLLLFRLLNLFIVFQELLCYWIISRIFCIKLALFEPLRFWNFFELVTLCINFQILPVKSTKGHLVLKSRIFKIRKKKHVILQYRLY